MSLSLVKCDKCQAAVIPENLNSGEFAPCPSCQSLLLIEVFPAILKTPGTTAAPQPGLVEGESSCFFHPAKSATVVCQGCGRFLCSLCDLEVNGCHLCPTCLELGQKKSKFQDLENTRMLWDHLALTVAILPLMFIWTSIIGAPAALYIVLRHRKAPCSLTGKSNVKFAAAAVLAILQIGAWALVIILALTR